MTTAAGPIDPTPGADLAEPSHSDASAIPISLVVAVARNGVIGADGGLPWRVRADLRRFRKITLGNPVIMGRATFQSIGRPMDGRDNIVLTRSLDFAPDGVFPAGSVAEALELARIKAAERGAGEICVIGGGVVFAEMLPLADRLHWTDIDTEPAGEVRFPEVRAENWTDVSCEKLPVSAGDTAAAIYRLRQRRR